MPEASESIEVICICNYQLAMHPATAAWFLFVALAHSMSLRHNFASFEQTYLVSQSQSLKQLYLCKDRCMSIAKDVGAVAKYTRIVWAQPHSQNRYIEGHCFFSDSPQTEQIQNWVSAKNYQEGKLLQNNNVTAFVQECEEERTEMSPELRTNIGLTLLHSSYEFYSTGKFLNVAKSSKNINDLLAEVMAT